MTSRSSHPAIEEYRNRYRDSRSVAEYQSSLQSPRTIRDLLQIRRSLGWLVGLAERRAIFALIGKAKANGRILDAPCGGGKLNGQWNRGNWVVGVDSSRHMLRHFLTNGGREAVQADIGHLPFRDGSVELIISNRLLHRIPSEGRMEILGELRRVSAKWAVLYYAVSHRGRGWTARVNRKLRLADVKHIFLCTPEGARREIRKSRWQIRAEASILMGVSAGHVFLAERA